MASFFSHPAFPVAVYLSRRGISKPLLIYSSFLTLFPDADVIAFRFGIPYHSQWGHRGFTHSIVFALIMAFISVPFAKKLEANKLSVFWMAFLSTLSHAVFDAFTNGGLGVAFFWPFTHERYFFPYHPVEVSPIGVLGFISMRGVMVVLSEILWIWLPCLSLSFLLRKLFAQYRRTRQS